MPETEISKQLRAILADAFDAPPLKEFLDLLDTEVAKVSSPDRLEYSLGPLEEDLINVYDEAVDHASLSQLEVFLEVLYHLKANLSSLSLISTWFDLLLRPGLREPRLAPSATSQAKELILIALENIGEHPEKVGEFRRRVMDLYLLDALNEGSGDDVLEWADLDEHEREKRVWWKNNLEHTLAIHALTANSIDESEKEFLTVAFHCFASPTSRLQILILLDSFISHPRFIDISPQFGCHPLLSSLLLSLQLDNSSTVCTFGMSALVKLLPILAIKACNELIRILPDLFAILGRIVTWKPYRAFGPPSLVPYADLLDQQDSSLVSELEQTERDDNVFSDGGQTSRDRLHLREGLSWERLEHSFDITSPPSPFQYFSFLYYLFPCNLVAFLRGPSSYLTNAGFISPYTVGWEQALDDIRVRTECESLLRRHVAHPSIITSDARAELGQPGRWASYEISQILGECVMLEVGNAAVSPDSNHSAQLHGVPPVTNGEGPATPTIGIMDLYTTQKHRISIQDMIATSIALKSGAEVEIIDQGTLLHSTAFLPGRTSAGESTDDENGAENGEAAAAPPGGSPMPQNVVETIAALQREVLLLRNELNFELWLKRENVRHIGRLYQSRVESKSADLERQGLHNKLREYKGQLAHLQRELTKHQGQAMALKDKYSEWNVQLQTKLMDLREQKKAWTTEAMEMRNSNKQLQTHLAAQGVLLADAQNMVFQLQSQIKEDAHKVQRLRDYEKRIEQLTAMHRMWNEDVETYNEQAAEIAGLQSDYQKMVLRLESYEKTQMEMEEVDRANRRRIQTLEANLRARRQSSDEARRNPVHAIATFSQERSELGKVNGRLRQENELLREEVEEMKAMVEVLKTQITGRRGLVHPSHDGVAGL
ncbi:hypothetical protein BD410DRAFT_762281 [Rickenella mellea]|uniref:Tuberous sclerosis 1 n=1 Tax=Rickenella mellea TaxID=50990 RepID=A0A4Y7QJ22_9AGAM|nr:hypothetical protein BD410DRAFT_762281 [Rickenella mellea]